MIPTTQTAVQLVGPGQLELNAAKPVDRPGHHQILGRVACVGLCFSDMKLLKQFDQHVRKSPVVAHLDATVLGQIPSYVPEGAPTVPGHEVVLEVLEVGAGVTTVEVGKRYLVQADWRDLRTAGSNGAFGYNFEGGLQQYVLLDERCTVAADGTSYLMPADDESRSVSATALVEPWACVEQAFIHHERTGLKAGGRLLVVQCPGASLDLDLDLPSAEKLFLQVAEDGTCPTPEGFTCLLPEQVAEQSIDDLVFAGTDADLLDRVLPWLANGGLALLLAGDGSFGRPVSCPVGRVHYGNVRLVGYPGTSLARCLSRIPETGEVRPGDRVHVVGAAGPMGSMATIRIVSMALDGVAVEASDMAEERLEVLRRKTTKLASDKGVDLHVYNPKEEAAGGAPDYVMLMVPVGPLVAANVAAANPGAIINIFAGIPADVWQAIDLDAYCRKGCYFIGTSGSTMRDMEAVLAKVRAGDLDTNLSVGAVSGMTGAIAGLEAVRDGQIAGKILVYPELGDFPLTTLEDLVVRYPSLGPLLDDGNWTKAAENELLALARA